MTDHELLWYKDAVFYEVYPRAFYDSDADGHGDLRGLSHKLDYLKDLGVDCLWMLPHYVSPLKDDGYDIADFYGVHPDYGSIEDFKALIKAAHARGLRVITDLVLNHTSEEHPWFQAARKDRESPYRDYYVWSDSDQKYSKARIIFIDSESSNWTWDESAGQHYWHRFYASQPDLNFDNTKVREEVIKIIRFWLDLGVDGFRVDAVPYLYEREGSNCENLPETHAFLKELRRFVDENYPGRILLCEANQWPEDARAYYGDGDEFHMGFHFPVMPRIFMALGKENKAPLEEILARTPAIPPAAQWCIFLRNHDELTLEMVSEEEREWMWATYAPEPRMRLNLGIRRRLAPLLDNDRRKIELANSLLFTLPGSPIIYYGDEIGMGDDIWLPDRNGVRTPMQWNAKPNAGFSACPPEKLYSPLVNGPEYGLEKVNVAAQQVDPNSLHNRIRHMLAVRKQHKVFGWGEFTWVEGAEQDEVAAYTRTHDGECLFALHNLSSQPQSMNIQVPAKNNPRAVDLLRGERLAPADSLDIQLEAYEYRWLLF